MSYVLKEISEVIAEQTKANWLEVVGEEVFATEYSGLFEYFATGQTGEVHYKALLNGGEDTAKAFVHIISRPKALKTKLLNVYICPRLLNDGTKEDIINLYNACIIETAKISAQDGTEIFKIYARENSLLSFLIDLCDYFNKNIGAEGAFKVKMAGRWLEICKK